MSRPGKGHAQSLLVIESGRITPLHCGMIQLPTADPNRQDLTPVRAKKPEKPSTATARPSTAAPPPPTLFEQLAGEAFDCFIALGIASG